MADAPVLRQCIGSNFDLLMCWKNPGICVGTCVCPCNTGGHLGRAEGKSCCLYGCFTLIPLLNCYFRMEARKKLKGGTDIEQFITSCCCFGCSLCQEAREKSSCDELTKVSECWTSAQKTMK